MAGALAFGNGVAKEQALRNLVAKDFNGEELLGLTFTTFEAYTRKHQTVQVWKWSAQRWRWNRPAPRSKRQRRSAPAGRYLRVPLFCDLSPSTQKSQPASPPPGT